MNTLFSCSNKLVKWLKIDLPRIKSADGKKIGTQTIQTTTSQLTFQLQGFEYKEQRFILVVEASTKFCIIIPLSQFEQITLISLQHIVFSELFNYSIYLIQEITKNPFKQSPEALELLIQNVKSLQLNTNTVRNTDMSLGGMLSDTQHWITSFINDYGLDKINKNSMFNLSMNLNSKPKKSIQWQLPAEQFTALVMNIFYTEQIDELFQATQSTAQSTIQPAAQPSTLPDLESDKNSTTKQKSDNIIDFQAYKDKSEKTNK
ncbi:MAG: hypothetical protein HRU38_23765 [Saccharospirillaceae bacterium]|nr:hypothetical protein [Pseudomonadales bacterium]NRB81640.1 hypothetical protein [Saccharospirillaceae bacterium]